MSRVAAAPLHPLDPLTAEELVTIKDVLTKSGRFSPETRFAWIELDEPPKAIVEGFQPGKDFPRRAYVAALDFGRKQSLAGTVDINAQRLAMVDELGRLQPGLTDHDLELARKVIDSEPRIKDALVKHGLRIPRAVSDSVRELFMGVGEDPVLQNATGRLVRVLFISDQDSTNDFGPILDSVMAVVDVYGGRLVHLYSVPGVPIRKVPHDIFDPRVRGSIARTEPLVPAAVPSANLTVNANVIRWTNWEMRFGFNLREGLVLHQIRFDDNGRKRSILYRASVSEVASRYGDPTRAWPWLEFLDEGNFGLGYLSAPVAAGRDVPPGAVTLSPLLPDPDQPGFSSAFPDRIYVYERDGGMLLYYRQDGATIQARSTELVVGFLAVPGNYAYGLHWVFKQDGSFAFEAELAGQILTKLVAAEQCQSCQAMAAGPGTHASPSPTAAKDDRYGTLVHPHVVGVNHQHWFNLRLDFDVDGANNAVMENGVEILPHDGKGASDSGPFFTVTHNVFGKSVEAKRDVDDSTGRTWTIYNSSSRSATGRPAGYSIVPVGNASTVFPHRRETGPAGFTFHHLWVTPYRDGQLYSDGKYPNQAPADYGDTLYHYADGEPIYDKDIVVWYSLGETHVVRPEDYPLMPNARLSVEFVPDGFFPRNPALGLAIETGEPP